MYKFGGSPWYAADNLSSKSFICWNCNNQVASSKGYKTFDEQFLRRVYICPHCAAPTSYDVEGKTPISSLPGKEIKKLPENIQNVYDEVRKCMQSNSFTGAVMLMRKIIMNIAVHEGAKEGLSFADYIDFLYTQGIVPKKSKSKADSVRAVGNSANHEIE